MANAMKVAAEPREAGGTSQSRRLRRGGVLPGVVYGEGAAGLKIQVNEHIFNKAMRSHEGEHLIMDLDIAGQGSKKVLLQEVQHHPVSGKIIHVDFHEISMTKKLRIEIPIKLVGEPVGVSQLGGVMEYLIRAVQVECLPSDIMEHIDIDVTFAVGVDHALGRIDQALAAGIIAGPGDQGAHSFHRRFARGTLLLGLGRRAPFQDFTHRGLSWSEGRRSSREGPRTRCGAPGLNARPRG